MAEVVQKRRYSSTFGGSENFSPVSIHVDFSAHTPGAKSYRDGNVGKWSAYHSLFMSNIDSIF